MKPPKFHVGQYVECVSDDWKKPNEGIRTPTKGSIYLIKSIKFHHSWDVKWWQFWKRKYYLELKELPGWYWASNFFAPVEELPAEALAELLEETLTPTVAV